MQMFRRHIWQIRPFRNDITKQPSRKDNLTITKVSRKHHKSEEDGHCWPRHIVKQRRRIRHVPFWKECRRDLKGGFYHWKTIGFSAKKTDHTSAHSRLDIFTKKIVGLSFGIGTTSQKLKTNQTVYIYIYIDFKLGIHEPPSWTVDVHRSYADVCASLKLWSSLL